MKGNSLKGKRVEYQKFLRNKLEDERYRRLFGFSENIELAGEEDFVLYSESFASTSFFRKSIQLFRSSESSPILVSKPVNPNSLDLGYKGFSLGFSPSFFLSFSVYLYYNIHIMKRTNIYLSDKQDADLRQIAIETDVKFAEHVRRALDDYIKKLKREKKLESL